MNHSLSETASRVKRGIRHEQMSSCSRASDPHRLIQRVFIRDVFAGSEASTVDQITHTEEKRGFLICFIAVITLQGRLRAP